MKVLLAIGLVLVSQFTFTQSKKSTSESQLLLRLKSNPEDKKNSLKLISYYFKNKNYKAIVDHFVALESQLSMESLKYLALTYQQLSNRNKALKIYDKMLIKQPNNYHLIYNQAKIYKDIYQYEKAIKLLSQIVTTKPKFLPAYMTLTDVFIEKESFHEALNVIYDMKKNTGEQPYTLNKTCELQSLLNLHTQSMRSCKIAIKKNPRVAENYVYLAQAHEVKGNDKEREWLLKKTQKRFRDNALALREFGRLLKDQGNCHLAIKWLSQSIKINDKDKISHKIFADCNFKSKNYVEALNSYTKQCQLEKMISHEFKTATATLNQQGQFQWAQKYELNMSQCSTFQKKKINSLFESY